MAVNKPLCKWVRDYLQVDFDATLRLFVNNHTPSISDADDASDYTEASGTWYTPITMSSWSPSGSGPGFATLDHAEVGWTPDMGSSGTAYGVYITNPDGDLFCAMLFESPIAITDGVPITATVRVTVRDPAAA